jgi:CheY-like chemotaxis protein
MTEVEKPTTKLPAQETYRILILEDSGNIDKLKEICKRAGHEVVPVLTIKEALAFLDRRDHVDVIVTAVHLENESVFEFLQRVKKPDSVHVNVPVLMLCSEPSQIGVASNTAVEIAASWMGADRYIFMPVFDPELLIQEVEQLFGPMPLKELNP